MQISNAQSIHVTFFLTKLMYISVFVIGPVAEESPLQQFVDPEWKNEH